MEKPSIIIVVPLYRPLLDTEIISLHQLRNYLGVFPICFIAPEGFELELRESEEVIHFDNRFFSSIHSYSRLLISKFFYKLFYDYDYILIYQLDCLVFSDQLEAWCAAGYDYIGAPWFVDPYNPSEGFSRVGNGGLSLRIVKSHLKVLESSRVPGWNEALSTRLPDLNGQTFPQRLYKQLKVIHAARHGVDWYTSHYSLNEDHFWSDRARLFWPDFKIAPVSAGLKFSFERYPRYCFERNRRQLPFGCHAWAKWDREFWEPFLIN